MERKSKVVKEDRGSRERDAGNNYTYATGIGTENKGKENVFEDE